MVEKRTPAPVLRYLGLNPGMQQDDGIRARAFGARTAVVGDKDSRTRGDCSTVYGTALPTAPTSPLTAESRHTIFTTFPVYVIGSDISPTLAILSLCALLLLLPKRNAVGAVRCGIDPGLFGFKTIPGKLHFLINGHKVVKARYEKAKNEPYYLQAKNVDRLVLPPKQLPELRMKSSSTLSGSVASVKNTLGEYSGVDIILKDRQSHDICKTRLAKSLPTLIPHLAECLKRHVQEKFGGPRRSEIKTFLFRNGSSVAKCDYPIIFEHFIATAPNIVPELRREIEKAQSKTGGEWSIEVLKDLKLMDSFIKESSRCNPHGYLGFNHVLLTDVTLSDGLRLPKGQFISFPEESMLRDAEFFDDPDTFDSYRYWRKRIILREENSLYELTGIEDYNLNWGYGKGTCPGRWYAAAVVELMLGIILTDYDVKFPDHQKERPPNEHLDTMIQPCRAQKVVFEQLAA
ncbi:cytochrome P450 [Polyplosphaeria fusca]|uniref:Cytochrome P450 n=1 Tax=Polyplosphaeria fusca TaxID=682080 RepID=A0A9P4RCP7_9PLEO|nr:cytochrome P450 [Polyplosphaeria fusca]